MLLRWIVRPLGLWMGACCPFSLHPVLPKYCNILRREMDRFLTLAACLGEPERRTRSVRH